MGKRRKTKKLGVWGWGKGKILFDKEGLCMKRNLTRIFRMENEPDFSKKEAIKVQQW